MIKTILCNWKMHGDFNYCNQINELFEERDVSNFNIVICPPNTLLHKLSRKNFSLGAQDCSAEIENFYTGEISIRMLEEALVTHVIIGHSERRKHFNEATEKILQKLSIILSSSLNPVICVKKFIEDERYIKDIYNCIGGFMMANPNSTKKFYIAYEPESSIGSGIADTLYSIEENYSKIKSLFKNYNNVDVLYGGSVNHKNIKDILKICDGILLGKASVNLDEFVKILNVNDC